MAAPRFAHAFWVESPGHSAIREEALAPPLAGEALVRTLYSGISRGSESLVFTGGVPASEHQRMRAPFQVGEFDGPVKYGYCNVGCVELGPPALLGATVFTLYPHQTRFVVPLAAVTPLPQSVPPARAVLAANMETAINGLWDAGLRVGDRIAVIGAGAVGCMVAWLAARIPGCDVELIDINPARVAVARTLGVRFATPATAHDEVDCVIHCSGSEAGLVRALELAAFEAVILEMSWYGTHPVSLPLGNAFHAKRLTVRSSQVGSVATAQRARWTYRRRLELALSMLADDALDVLITGESEFSELPRLMPKLAAGSVDTICHRVRYS